MNKLIFGLVGAAAVLLTTTAFAANTCSSGTINAIGSGSIGDSSVIGTNYKIRWVDVTCNDDLELSGTFYIHPSTDPDGKLAIALTALAHGTGSLLSSDCPVSYTIYPGPPANVYMIGLSMSGPCGE